jgi:transposase
VKRQRTSVGLDVHARSVVGCALDGDTGEVRERRMTPDHSEITQWIGSLAAPVSAVYEAGPTGFGLARSLLLSAVGYCRRLAKFSRPLLATDPKRLRGR